MENVLTVKRELIENYIQFTGIKEENCDKVVDIIINNHEFIPREIAEKDPSHKQPIPYVVITRGSEIFVMKRLKKGGEARLHGLLSLGVGGHINNDNDIDDNDVLTRGMLRELHEEVKIENYGKLIPRGLINDDTTEVGSVHLGLFYTMEVTGNVEILEKEKLSGEFISREILKNELDNMETWSSFAFKVLENL